MLNNSEKFWDATSLKAMDLIFSDWFRHFVIKICMQFFAILRGSEKEL